MKKSNINRRYNQRSFVLIVAIIIISILMVAIWEYTYIVTQNLRIASNMVKEVQAISIARAAFRGGLAILQRDGANVDGPHDEWRLLMPPVIPLGYGTAKLQIEAEDGKLNVNNLVQGAEFGEDLLDTTHYAYMKALFDILGYDLKPVDAIIDFTDKNDESFGHGAEKDYYEGLKPPVIIKNGPLDTITELLMVKDITLGMFYGESDESKEGSSSHETKTEKKSDEEEEIKVWSPKGLRHYLTVYGTLEGKSNYSKININFMPLRLLQAMNEEIEEYSLKEIERFRKDYNLETKHLTFAYMNSNFGITEPVHKYFFSGRTLLKVNSEYFRIRGYGEVENITRVVESVVQRIGQKGSAQFKILYYEEM